MPDRCLPPELQFLVLLFAILGTHGRFIVFSKVSEESSDRSDQFAHTISYAFLRNTAQAISGSPFFRHVIFNHIQKDPHMSLLILIS